LITTFGATAGITMLITLLPAILELKKPLDAGPRLIIEDFTHLTTNQFRIPLMNLEDEINPVNQLNIKLPDFPRFVPNLET
jgi:hypothetical protein